MFFMVHCVFEMLAEVLSLR